MRQNLPVYDIEKALRPDQKLISSTDLRGKIVHCNNDFVEISGFTRDELIGQPHNILRHPDMPEQVFHVMWEYLKAGKPWMGLVKNRCKQGGFYWVNAYVTPITENGEVVGYESVRSFANRKMVDQSVRVYEGIRNKTTPYKVPKWLGISAGLTGLILPTVALAYNNYHHAAEGYLITGMFIAVGVMQRLEYNSLKSIKKIAGDAFTHPVATQTYTSDRGLLGDVKVAFMSEQSHLDTVLTRIEDSSGILNHEIATIQMQSKKFCEAMKVQQDEAGHVAAAMFQMSASINEVSSHVQNTSERVEETSLSAQSGRELSVTTRESIESLSGTVDQIKDSISNVAGQTNSIYEAAEEINKIANRTNLLALNAAIEAARAGDYGRGFTVVADEVRDLAHRTQEFTQHIQSILESLTPMVKKSMDIASEGQARAERGLSQVIKTESMLVDISDSMSQVSEMAFQMAAAVEEQAQVSGDINSQVNNISNLSIDSLAKSEDSMSSINKLANISAKMDELVIGFRH